MGEVSQLSAAFARTVSWLRERRPDLQFLAAFASDQVRSCSSTLEVQSIRPYVQCSNGRAQQVMAASDVVLLASGPRRSRRSWSSAQGGGLSRERRDKFLFKHLNC